jgi:cellulose biosynthesis protein BcsQ
MNKVQLILLDEDSFYAERLAAFIRSSEYAEQLQPKLFTRTEYVEKLQLEEDVSSCILLASESYLADCLKYRNNLCLLSLSSSPQAEESETNSDMQSLYRFQPLHQLLARMLGYYKLRHAGNPIVSRKGTPVVSFYSAIGNCGKTLSALHLSRELAFRGKRVFYLNLEAPSCTFQLLKGADPQHFSQILYYVKSSPELLTAKLELYKKHDSRLGFDYLSPCHHIREAQEMGSKETRLLLEAVIALNHYDYIVVDLEASFHPRTEQALRMSDHTVWIVLDDLNCLHKTKAAKKMIGPVSGIHYVLNKYTGSVFNDFAAADITFDGYLPYIPEWKTVHTDEQILSASVFSEQVMSIFETSVLSQREGAPA